MPSISGSVFYATGRFGGISGTTGIPSIPVVIQDRTSGNGIVVLTNASGGYTVNNVPAGSYRIV